MHTLTIRAEDRPEHPRKKAQLAKAERSFALEILEAFQDTLGEVNACIGQFTLTIVRHSTHLGIDYVLEYGFGLEIDGAKHPIQVTGRYEFKTIGSAHLIVHGMRHNLGLALEQAEEASLEQHGATRQWNEYWRQQQADSQATT